MGGIWLVWLIFASILGYIIAIIVLEDSPPTKTKECKEDKPWIPKSCEVGPDQKWFTKY